MIWATISSLSCFCWLYRASPSVAAKNIISLISILAICWCPCVELSLVLLEESICYDQRILLAKLYSCLPCFILYSKAKFVCYSRCLLTLYFCILVPRNDKGISFCPINISIFMLCLLTSLPSHFCCRSVICVCAVCSVVSDSLWPHGA